MTGDMSQLITESAPLSILNGTNVNNHENAADGIRTSTNWLDLTILCIKGVIFSTIIIGAVLGNALVIISVQRNRKLR